MENQVLTLKNGYQIEIKSRGEFIQKVCRHEFYTGKIGTIKKGRVPKDITICRKCGLKKGQQKKRKKGKKWKRKKKTHLT